jgi:hypothetical protein
VPGAGRFQTVPGGTIYFLQRDEVFTGENGNADGDDPKFHHRV